MRIDIPRIKNWISSLMANSKVIARFKGLLFTGGLLVFLAVQCVLVVFPILNRTAPVETDDAYTYIVKASEMKSCFLQDCPALNDLRSQLTEPSADPEISWLRYREYVRTFSIYHPLHSLILVGMNQAGLSWEISYQVLVITGSLGLSLAIAYWLYSLFGVGPTGIALFFLAFTIFPGQGFYKIVPSSMALGIALLTWGLLINKRNGSLWIFLFSTLILVIMHPIGRLYALLTIFLYLFLNWQHLTRKVWLFGTLSILIIAITFILPILIERPDLSVIADPPPAMWQNWWGYYNNVIYADRFVKQWFDLLGGFFPTFFCIIIGILSLARNQQRSRILVLVLPLIGLMFISLFQVLPHYPAETFSRVWIPFVIIITGIVAQVIWQWATIVFRGWGRAINIGFPDFRNERWILSLKGWGTALLLMIGIILAQIGINYVVVGQRMIRTILSASIERQNSFLVSSQPKILIASGCEDVLYLGEVPMHFYLTHGAWDCGAVYYPGLAGTSEETSWVQQNPNLDFVVTWNPTVQATVTGGGSSLALKTGDWLEFHLPEQWKSQFIYVYLENPGSKTSLDISGLHKETGGMIKVFGSISLPANWSGWQKIDATADELAQGFRLGATQTTTSIFLRGAKLDPDSVFNWPWDQELSLIYQPVDSSDPAVKINFDTADLVPFLNWPLQVLDDQGDTVLLRVKR